MSHLRTRGVRRARRLPTVMQRKLATCQGTKGRICFASHCNSFGILRDRTTSHSVKQVPRSDLELKDRFRYWRRPDKAFTVRISVNFIGCCWNHNAVSEGEARVRVRKSDPSCETTTVEARLSWHVGFIYLIAYQLDTITTL